MFPHLVQGHCANQTVFYGAGEQVGTGLLHQHTDDVSSGAVMGRSATPQTAQVCCVEIVSCFVFFHMAGVLCNIRAIKFEQLIEAPSDSNMGCYLFT